MTGPAERPQQAQPAEPTQTDRTFLYQSCEHAEAPDTWTADAAYPADSPVPYTLTAKAETVLGEASSPTPLLPAAQAYGTGTRPPHAGPGPAGRAPAYITEISMPPSGSGIHRLHVRMAEPGPEPEAGL